jgi:hypothetical protein
MADGARLPDAQRSHALLIGVGEFTDNQLAALPSVRNNLTGLFEGLTSPWGAGLPDTHCTMLADPADMETVGDHLVQIADQAQDLVGWPEGIAPSGSHRSVRKPLDLHGSCHPGPQAPETHFQCANMRGYRSVISRSLLLALFDPCSRLYFLRIQRTK